MSYSDIHPQSYDMHYCYKKHKLDSLSIYNRKYMYDYNILLMYKFVCVVFR